MNYRPYPDRDRALAQLERGFLPEPQPSLFAWVDEHLAPEIQLTDWQRQFVAAWAGLAPKKTGRTAITAAIADQAVQAGEHVHVASSDDWSVRDQLLAALDFSYVVGPLGYDTPEALLAAYDASRTPTARAALRDTAEEFDYPRDPDAELILNTLPPEAQRSIRAQLAAEARQDGTRPTNDTTP